MNPFTKYPHLYQPFKIGKGNVVAKNRFEIPPMGPRFGAPSTVVDATELAYYAERARTGAGIVTIPDTGIDTTTAGTLAQNYWIDGKKSISELKKLTKVIHRYGALASIELNHAGEVANAIDRPAFKVSEVQGAAWTLPEFAGNARVKIMDQDDIDYVIRTYVEAVEICREAGFDMVMIHGAHGTLPAQFVSPLTNQRTDRYGGSPEKRMTFHKELFTAIRQKVGPEFPIELRVSWTEHTPGGLEINDVIGYLKEIEYLIDLVHVSAGAQPTPKSFAPYYYPKLVNLDGARRIRETLSIPVVAMGSILTLEDAESIIATGKADMVALGRPGLAGDDLFLSGQLGKTDEEIRPCLRCGHCMTNVCMLETVGCTVNPRLGNEFFYPNRGKADVSKKVVIVGGGPAGMQAALTARERGHQVVLFEKQEMLGGLLPAVCAHTFKDEFRRYYKWLVSRVSSCGADLRLNTEATPAMIAHEKPDAVILAVGGQSIGLPQFPLGGNIAQVLNVDLGLDTPGHKVLIAGGGLSGVECAFDLADSGREVTIVDPKPVEQWAGGKPQYYETRMELLAEKNIRILPGVGVVRPTQAGALLRNAEGCEFELEADTIILALGGKPDPALVEPLSGIVPETYVIGDAAKNGDVYEATHSAYYCVMEL